MDCDFCYLPKDVDKVDKRASSYICGTCVQYLINQSQEELLRGHNLATERRYERKARAIKSFMEGESKDESRKPKRNGKYPHGKRTVRTIGNEKVRIGRITL